MTRTFLYTEAQLSLPFEHFDWATANPLIRQAPGLINKTWLSGLGNGSLGGLYLFDSTENALAFARGPFAEEARQAGAAATTRVFDADVVAAASADLDSPFFR
ncbi:MAG: putative mono-oxygenase [Ilumatobacteraceae bacterium]|nr:putative mono-oxygenase [Ilumatobacteraceae bacterium]